MILLFRTKEKCFTNFFILKLFAQCLFGMRLFLIIGLTFFIL